ncbi:MAG: SufD family Fe-S cluster assembly protein, partial [Bacteroidetes bacterium]|nr:SufD family Fe-S cluster assembly protein [Bacteroidota bacterium]
MIDFKTIKEKITKETSSGLWGGDVDELIEKEKFAEALIQLNWLTKKFPKNDNFWRDKGDVLYELESWGEANQAYAQALKIKPNATNCEGYQKDDTILLSEDAQADVVPNLEIANNDVKCSHGATISQIDEDKLLRLYDSQGISPEIIRQEAIKFNRKIKIPFSFKFYSWSKR